MDLTLNFSSKSMVAAGAQSGDIFAARWSIEAESATVFTRLQKGRDGGTSNDRRYPPLGSLMVQGLQLFRIVKRVITNPVDEGAPCALRGLAAGGLSLDGSLHFALG